MDDLLGERHLEAAHVREQVDEVHECLGRHPAPTVDNRRSWRAATSAMIAAAWSEKPTR